MNKLFIGCTLLYSLTQPGQLSAQNKNLLMGIGNDNTHGQYNTSLGFIDDVPGSGNPPYTSGWQNTFVGANSGNYSGGSDNTAVGYQAGSWFLNGGQNVFVGSMASANPATVNTRNSVGSGNSIIGFKAGFYNQADYNVFLGWQSGYNNSSGGSNAFVGTSTGYANTSGKYNTFMGYAAGYKNTEGNYNAYLGYQAGYSSTTCQYNAFVGSDAGYKNTSGGLNTFLGYQSGYNNTIGGSNTFVGYQVGYANTTGLYSTFVGYAAGYRNTTGYSNVSLGSATGFANQTGHNNVMIGDSAGLSNTVSNNVFVGSKAGYSNQTGSQNTFVGYQAGKTITTGSNNIIIGPSSGTAITDGNDNVLMGYNSQAEDGLHNAIAIGTGSRVAISNALILGHQVNVGIGTSAPTDRLEVVSDKPDASGLRLTNLTSSSPATQSTDQFLTVNQRGEIVKARYQLRISDPTQWSDTVFSPAYSLRSLASVASYISQHGHLPGVPSAAEVVEQGVDLVKMNATLLEKVEELTLYSIQQQRQIDQQKRELAELTQLVKQLLDKK